jgi:hypothetical protein
MIAALTKELAQEENEEDHDDGPTTPSPKKHRTTRRVTRNFFTYMQPLAHAIPSTFLGASPLTPYKLRISFKLPFLKVSLGEGGTSDNKATLTGLADTGGCCNMGWLSYHQEIAQRYPHLVHEFTDLTENNMKPYQLAVSKEE